MARKRGRRSKPFKIDLKKDTTNSILAVIVIGLGGLLAISFSRQGPILSQIYQTGSQLFGWTFILMPFIFVSGGLILTKINWPIASPNVFLGSLIVLIALTGLSHSGNVGKQLFLSISSLITVPGTYLFYFLGAFIGLLILFETSLEDVFVIFQSLSQQFSTLFSKIKQNNTKSKFTSRGKTGSTIKIKGMGIKNKSQKEEKEISPSPSKKEKSVITPVSPQISSSGSSTIWEAPPLNLLSDQKLGKADRGDINNNASIIEKTLDSFGITAKVVEVNQGPAVTQYALEIALGVKLSKITARQSDLALALAAPQGQIRIEAPIPGRSLVGVEIPNRSLEFVTLKEMLTSEVMQDDSSRTLCALGLDVAGKPIVTDITKMPHVLIAGATGSGKSVMINAIIASILFRASPEEVKFIMVDPKRVELSLYNDIPHLMTPVIVDAEKVINALGWAVSEMERRYKLLAEVGVKNIASYNNLSGFQAMPYIVIIIDELADIMLISPHEVEEKITRLAQMARAVGIHLIVATQRPSVNVITGLIKANIPCRIAFQVTSMIDSRVIIDSPGAEKLLGRGDMLYVPPDQARPRRIQGAFVSEKEIKNLINHLRKSGVDPEYQPDVIKEVKTSETVGLDGQGMDDADDLFIPAIKVCLSSDKASASLLQRRLSIGYARAARILDQLQAAGVVSAQEGNKPREVIHENANKFLSQNQTADTTVE